MEIPTIVSSGPDSTGRAKCSSDEYRRQAHYGRIRPMQSGDTLLGRLTRWMR